MFAIKIFNPPSYEEEPDYTKNEHVVKTYSYSDWTAFRRGWRRNLAKYEGFYYAAFHDSNIIVAGAYDPLDSEYLDDYRESIDDNGDYIDWFGNFGEGNAAVHDLMA